MGIYSLYISKRSVSVLCAVCEILLWRKTKSISMQILSIRTEEWSTFSLSHSRPIQLRARENYDFPNGYKPRRREGAKTEKKNSPQWFPSTHRSRATIWNGSGKRCAKKRDGEGQKRNLMRITAERERDLNAHLSLSSLTRHSSVFHTESSNHFSHTHTKVRSEFRNISSSRFPSIPLQAFFPLFFCDEEKIKVGSLSCQSVNL